VRTSAIFACLLAFHCCAVARQEEAKDTDYDKAYKAGVVEADEELKSGTATLYGHGLRRLDAPLLDRTTGLPIELIAGCVVDSSILGRAAGHNKRIEEFIAKRGLPTNSFKRWEKDLFDLKGYYEKRSKTENPERLRIGGPAAKSPDGKYALRLVKEQLKGPDGTLSDHSSVVISVDDVDQGAVLLIYGENVDCLWGPKGAGFAVIRGKGEGRWQEFTALDLKRGKLLRDE
jgi:hypothetical protein